MEYQETNDLIQDLAQIVSNHTNQVQSIQPQAAVPILSTFTDELLTDVTQSFWEQNIRLETLLSLSICARKYKLTKTSFKYSKSSTSSATNFGLYRQSYIESVLTYNKFLSNIP